jgi:hypothetical protein
MRIARLSLPGLNIPGRETIMQVNGVGMAALTVGCLAVGAAGVYVLGRGPVDPTTRAGSRLEEPNEQLGAPTPDPDLPEIGSPIAEAAQAPRASEPTPVQRVAVTAPALPRAPDRSIPVERDVRAPRAPEIAPAAEVGDGSVDSGSGTAAFPEEPADAIADPWAEPDRAPVAAMPALDVIELVVPAHSVIGLRMTSSISSENARLEDRVTAEVARDVWVGERVAIRAGSKVTGEVILVERGGRVRDKALLGVRFTSILLDGGVRVPIRTEMIVREGASPSSESSAKIGAGTIGGAILGGILGGKRGAVIGCAAGAGAGTAVGLASDRNPAVLATGSPITVRLDQSASVAVDE